MTHDQIEMVLGRTVMATIQDAIRAGIAAVGRSPDQPLAAVALGHFVTDMLAATITTLHASSGAAMDEAAECSMRLQSLVRQALVLEGRPPPDEQ